MFRRLREDIQSIFERDPAARSTLEVLTTYPGLHAIWMHRAAHRLWEQNWKWPARMISHCARGLTGIEIHPGARIGQRFFIDHGMGVVIGETAEVGDDCTLYHGVTLGGTSWQRGKRHPTLEDDVVVGAGAKILGPIRIGTGARVGSNSVVVKDVAPDSTVVGVPARSLGRKTTTQPHRHRQEIAAKMGFDAYGLTQEMPDPIAEAINGMLDHIHLMDKQLQELTELVRQHWGEQAPAGFTRCAVDPVEGTAEQARDVADRE